MTGPQPAASVLVVDDEAGIREILARWLEPAGYRIQQAEHAEAALAEVARSQPAVVLCDVNMPGHNGVWLVQHLRERYPHVAVVFATASEAVPPTISLRAGVVAYVLKPFERERLLAAVREAVAWHEAAVARGPQAAGPDPVEEWLRGNRRRG